LSVAYRGIEIDENGTGHVFVVRGFGEKCFIRSALCIFIGTIGVNVAIRLEAMLKEIPIVFPELADPVGDNNKEAYNSQAALPSWVPAWPRWM